VVGGASDDVLVGSATANVLVGGGGSDRLTGAGGADTLDGGAGDDVIDAIDGAADAIACGAGNDSVQADAQDAVAADCERADRAAAPAGGAGSGGVASGTRSVLLAGGSIALGAHRRVRVTLGCAAQAAPCAGRLTLRPRKRAGKPFASAPFRVAAGGIRTVALTVSRSAARRVRRGHRLAATLVATTGAEVAVPVTLTR
jgi:RTX calcium-binding nonapeptide repeat (4 copies)